MGSIVSPASSAIFLRLLILGFQMSGSFRELMKFCFSPVAIKSMPDFSHASLK